jgi:hypothetical protein
MKRLSVPWFQDSGNHGERVGDLARLYVLFLVGVVRLLSIVPEMPNPFLPSLVVNDGRVGVAYSERNLNCSEIGVSLKNIEERSY